MEPEANAGSNPAGEQPVIDSQVASAPPAPEPQGDITPAKSAREAVERAIAKVNGTEQPVQAGAQRDPATGKFAPKQVEAKEAAVEADAAKEVKTAAEAILAPKRFTKAAQAEWATVNPVVQAEIARMETELMQGLEKYKGEAEAFAPFKAFADIAKQHNIEPSKALENYVELDRLWARDKVGAFMETCKRTRTDPMEIVKAIAGPMLQQQQQQPESQIVLALQQQIAGLQQRLESFGQNFEENQTRQVYEAKMGEINSFAKDHPYFDDLMPTMTKLIQTGYVDSDLSKAYETAVQLNPEIAAKIAADKSAKELAGTPRQQGSNPKAVLSITGSPGAGSAPAAGKPSGSSREALQRAFAQVGMS